MLLVGSLLTVVAQDFVVLQQPISVDLIHLLLQVVSAHEVRGLLEEYPVVVGVFWLLLAWGFKGMHQFRGATLVLSWVLVQNLHLGWVVRDVSVRE